MNTSRARYRSDIRFPSKDRMGTTIALMGRHEMAEPRWSAGSSPSPSLLVTHTFSEIPMLPARFGSWITSSLHPGIRPSKGTKDQWPKPKSATPRMPTNMKKDDEDEEGLLIDRVFLSLTGGWYGPSFFICQIPPTVSLSIFLYPQQALPFDTGECYPCETL